MTTPNTFPLAELLSLERLDANLFRSKRNQANFTNALFGGQMLGQGLLAAAMTVESRRPHSLHGYFLLAGASDAPVIYDVEATRDGGSFSTRRVVARQKGRTIFTMEVSFHKDEPGYEHALQPDASAPDPEELLSVPEFVARNADRLPPGAGKGFGPGRGVEIRPIQPEDYFLRKSATASGRYWIKAGERLPDDALTQTAGLAYLSDYFLTLITVLPHATSVWEGTSMNASLDHAMWFHRPCRVDEWLLVEAMSPFAGGARGLARGHIFNRQRQLVASVAQEVLIRPR